MSDQQSNSNGCIYALTDPDTGEIRYIGQTDHLERRYKEHLNEHPKYYHTRKSRWIEELKEQGKQPGRVVLESNISDGDGDAREEYWIVQKQAEGCHLLNSKSKRLPGKGRYSVDLGPQYLTVRAFAKREGYTISDRKACQISRKAGDYSREHGYETGRAVEDYFGTLNTYHEDVLLAIFAAFFT